MFGGNARKSTSPRNYALTLVVFLLSALTMFLGGLQIGWRLAIFCAALAGGVLSAALLARALHRT
ncbi:MAG: hypothetical protein JWN80_654 [Microbacteriaceae bacterium]|jgi:membrane associated rhomboid family serine protease|nr:hypothetical protein [Microbacteriaceae bacterium]